MTRDLSSHVRIVDVDPYAHTCYVSAIPCDDGCLHGARLAAYIASNIAEVRQSLLSKATVNDSASEYARLAGYR